jgi:hypothetical protein
LESKEILVNQMVIFLDAIILLKRLRNQNTPKSVYLNFENRDFMKSMESLRPLKAYLKELHNGIFKNNLQQDLQYLL